MSRWQSEERDAASSDDGEELEGDWELDPSDPSHPDHDLSEAAGYAYWEPSPKPLLARRGAILLVTLLVIAGLVIIPVLARLT